MHAYLVHLFTSLYIFVKMNWGDWYAENALHMLPSANRVNATTNTKGPTWQLAFLLSLSL